MFDRFQPNTLFIGKNTHFLPTCHSTNDIALQMIQNTSVFEGQVVVTNHQTAGKGQRGNVWEAEAGQNLTFSIILKPIFLRADEQFKLNIAVSVGIYQFLSALLPEGLSIKWPNDVYFNDKKLGGVLIENSIQANQLSYSVVGIGLNINQIQFFDKKAISLLKINQYTNHYDLTELLSQLLVSIEQCYLKLKNNEYKSLKESYVNKLFRINTFHIYQQNGREFIGKIIDVLDSGKLMLEVDGNLELFDMKEIEFVF